MTKKLNITGPLARWPQDVLHAEDGKTYLDPDAIPHDLRTKKVREDSPDGSFHEIEPIAALRRCYLSVYAEIVRISYWIARKEDGTAYYQVNLVKKPFAFDRGEVGTLSLDSYGDGSLNELESVQKLLTDAKKFIEWHQEVTAAKVVILIGRPE